MLAGLTLPCECQAPTMRKPRQQCYVWLCACLCAAVAAEPAGEGRCQQVCGRARACTDQSVLLTSIACRTRSCAATALTATIAIEHSASDAAAAGSVHLNPFRATLGEENPKMKSTSAAKMQVITNVADTARRGEYMHRRPFAVKAVSCEAAGTAGGTSRHGRASGEIPCTSVACDRAHGFCEQGASWGAARQHAVTCAHASVREMSDALHEMLFWSADLLGSCSAQMMSLNSLDLQSTHQVLSLTQSRCPQNSPSRMCSCKSFYRLFVDYASKGRHHTSLACSICSASGLPSQPEIPLLRSVCGH